jgi:hypothetical protein
MYALRPVFHNMKPIGWRVCNDAGVVVIEFVKDTKAALNLARMLNQGLIAP